MKGIKILLKILLPIALLAVTMSFALESMVTKTITKDILAKKVSGYFLDQMIYEFDVDKLGEIETKIRESKYTEEITSEYIDTMIANLVEHEKQSLDITDKVNQILEKELKEEIAEEQKQEISEYLQRQSKQLEEQLEEDLPIGFNTYPFILILKIYHVLTSLAFRIGMSMLTIVILVLLAMLDKRTVLKDIQTGLLVTASISGIGLALLYLLSDLIEQRMSGGWIDQINTNLLIILIVTEIAISVILYWLNKKLDIKKEVEENLTEM